MAKNTKGETLARIGVTSEPLGDWRQWHDEIVDRLSNAVAFHSSELPPQIRTTAALRQALCACIGFGTINRTAAQAVMVNGLGWACRWADGNDPVKWGDLRQLVVQVIHNRPTVTDKEGAALIAVERLLNPTHGDSPADLLRAAWLHFADSLTD